MSGIHLSVVWQEIEPAKSALAFPALRGELKTLMVADAGEVRSGKFRKFHDMEG